MKISIITTDGGAGKTALSFAFAKELGYYLISNDDSVIELAYPEMAKIMQNPTILEDTVYDFGGFVDDGVLEIIKSSDIAIVPCINDLNSKMKAIKTIKELQKYNNNFLVVATRIEGSQAIREKEFREIEEHIHEHFEDIKVLPLRKTKMFKTALEYGMSPFELIAESNQIAYASRNVISEYKEILKYIVNDEDSYNEILKEKLEKKDA